ncbi:hypothetical protein [Chitinophaga sp.]|uniref:hypothetical protein n=1 Tax=Chitinophaga sp. TaxID=1869181 RepID=UPI0031D09FD4
MAISKNNAITFGASGTFAQQMVIRQQGGKTVLCKRPVKGKSKYPEKEQQMRDRFLEASLYARAAISHEPTRLAYQAAADKGQSAYNMAVADFYIAPVIRSVDSTAYTGAAGSTIRVRAIDNFGVQAVSVEIQLASGETLEKGNAAADVNGLDWLYTATQPNEALAGSKLIIRASDLPGNVTVHEVTL